jgi:uncharacterized membrane protein YfcA
MLTLGYGEKKRTNRRIMGNSRAADSGNDMLIALAAGLALGGVFHFENITLSALAVIPSLLGMWYGTKVRERISAATFRRRFLIFIAILDSELAIRPFFLSGR